MLREANLGRCSLVWSLAHNESRMHQQLGATERQSGTPNPAAQIHTLLLCQPWTPPGAAEEVYILLAIGHPPPHFWAGDTPGGTFDGLLPSPEPADEVVGSAEPQCFRNSHRSQNQMAGCPAIVCMQVMLRRLKFGSICSSFRCSEGPSMHHALAVQLAVCFGAEIPAKVYSIRSNFVEADRVHTTSLFLPTRIPWELRD